MMTLYDLTKTVHRISNLESHCVQSLIKTKNVIFPETWVIEVERDQGGNCVDLIIPYMD